MAENKTKATEASAAQYLDAIEDVGRRADCKNLAKLMAKVTGEKAKMWGTAIVGFGIHRYKYESGREGEICLVGFSSRKADITIYGTSGNPAKQELLAKLGKHKTGKGCLYIRKMSDVDPKVLEQLIAGAVKAAQKRSAK